ncbi:MAG TPA: NAD(P)/FAD-dependent oxidoreductase [Acidimicrobiales bacterium]|nr:NAD(P)/FAD-dependent oxidoreductase [Acidimicrobiales bacterium]
MGDTDLDVVVIGAGFAGLYAVYKLREAGFSVRVFERGDGIGGTWYWNRYPGARVDIQSVEYMFTKFPDLEQEWDWTELMPAQAEIERYLNWVTDKLDLRRDITFDTSVLKATFDDTDATWTVETDTGERVTAPFLVAATGCLSAPIEPNIAGLHDFTGDTLFTNRFPKDGYDFTGKRVAVVGTGSSGVQSIPVIAQTARELNVLQRSAAFTLPSPNRPLRPHELDELKAQYADIRAKQWASPAGTARLGAVFLGSIPTERILDTSWEDQLAQIDRMGMVGCFAWADSFVDLEANEAAVRLYGEAIKRIVNDPQTAADLVPHYPFGCKRVIIDEGYFESYNLPNVRLVNLRENPIVKVTPTGIQLQDEVLDLDVIVYATGFDAMTGSLSRIDIRGRDGVRLGDVWKESPQAYLGLNVAGFPNLFTVTGPGSPSVLTNMVTSIEHHVEWITDCLTHLRATGRRCIEAKQEAQEAWAEHVHSFAGPVQTHETCTSWYLGANVPGKTRYYMPYAGGLTTYMQCCAEIVEAGYDGFALV